MGVCHTLHDSGQAVNNECFTMNDSELGVGGGRGMKKGGLSYIQCTNT